MVRLDKAAEIVESAPTSAQMFLAAAQLRSGGASRKRQPLMGEAVDGSSRPRMYGLPKNHKSSCPLRPILSMSSSPQYAVSRWLCSLLKPVLSL